jgi:type IV pilus assembly protein PilV
MGILALMGLQAAAVKNSGDAKYRADATYLANQIIGQMWVDRGNISQYAHNPSGPPCSPTGTASTLQQVTDWLNKTNALLPSTSGVKQQITIGGLTSSSAYPVTVSICWQAPQDTTPHNFVVNAEINN